MNFTNRICRKNIFFLLLFLSPAIVFSQGSPLQWEVTSTKKSVDTYELTVKAKLVEGWHAYAEIDSALGLEALDLKSANGNIIDDKAFAVRQTALMADPLFDNKDVKVYKGNFEFKYTITLLGQVPATLKVTLTGFISNNQEFLPIEETKEVKLEGGVEVSTDPLLLEKINLANPAADCGDSGQKEKNLLSLFLLGFIGGLIALLTPCVFPMIPVTVGFFTNRSKTRRQGIANAILYGSFIFLIYVLASAPFHLVGNINPQIFNTISTNAWVNVFFFAVFVFFALSFFGLFDIKLPASVSNAAGARSGIFFMALTLVIVSFSCTGVILGSLLVNALSKDGNAWQLTAGMAGFGAALALPFGLFAMFPQWLKKLPKSGGWLETVKISLAFIELALAIKFLSNADLVEHWGILKREVFIGLWVLIATGLGLYLLGVFTKKNYTHPLLPNTNKIKNQNPWLRKSIGIIVLLFACYLVPGLTQTKYANLKLLSGFPPPLSYSIYGKSNVHGKGLEPDVINDYDKALTLARETGKPLLIDFTGWACVNCRKMEELVWTKPEIAQIIKENYILVSLYVDDREKLPVDQQMNYKNKQGEERNIRSIGDKWAVFQAVNFKQATQPLYVVLNPNEELMNHPVGYTPKSSVYKEWLECGVQASRQSTTGKVTKPKK